MDREPVDVITLDEQLRDVGVEVEVVAYIKETLPDGRSVTGTTQKLTIFELVDAMVRLRG